MPNFALPRSFVIRLTLIYAVVVTVSVIVLLAVVYIVTSNALTAQLDKDVETELGSLSSVSRLLAPDAFTHELQERGASLSKSQFIYALLDRNGRAIAGSQLSPPTLDGWSTIKFRQDSGSAKRLFRLKAMRLSDGTHLVVGADTDNIAAVRSFFLEAMPIGIGVALLLAFLGASLLSLHFWRRVERVARACELIMNGDLAVRAPVTGSRDEIDLVARSMNAMLDRIGMLMDALRQVTNDIAHDLRTPLSRLRHRLERVHLKARSISDYEHAVEAAIEESDALLDTFAALLRIAELESGALRSSFATVNLEQILSGVAGAYEADAEERDQRIVADLQPNVSICGESGLLTQMFANLIENAMRHSPNGATIQLQLSKSDFGTPKVTIADNGPGIPEADRARVFGRFVRLERSRTTPGSGLGLSLVAAIAGLHGVRIALSDNHPGLRCDLDFAGSSASPANDTAANEPSSALRSHG